MPEQDDNMDLVSEYLGKLNEEEEGVHKTLIGLDSVIREIHEEIQRLNANIEYLEYRKHQSMHVCQRELDNKIGYRDALRARILKLLDRIGS